MPVAPDRSIAKCFPKSKSTTSPYHTGSAGPQGHALCPTSISISDVHAAKQSALQSNQRDRPRALIQSPHRHLSQLVFQPCHRLESLVLSQWLAL